MTMPLTNWRAKSACELGEWLHKSHEGYDFLRVGEEILDSEDLVNRVYEVYLSLLAKQWQGQRGETRFKVDDIGYAYLDGFYMPCTKRIVFTTHVDIKNDPLPDRAGLVTLYKDLPTGTFIDFRHVRRIDRFPRGVVSACRGAKYNFTWMFPSKDKNAKPGTMEVNKMWAVVKPNGDVEPAQGEGGAHSGGSVAYQSLWSQLIAEVINANADAEHLWKVRTREAMAITVETPLVLGVSVEHVKSLFYARSLPLTESGRKRPILHWVRAHERRLRSGIDVDVRQHLRGIEAFEMGGFPFEIVNPTKESAQ